MVANISAVKGRPAIRAVAFDLDDTLFDRRTALLCLLDRWGGTEEGCDLAAEVLAADRNGHAPRQDFFRWFASRCPSLGADNFSLAARFRRELPACIVPDPVTLESLEVLQSEGLPLALLSNGNTSFQSAKLKACGAMPFFQKSHRLFSSTLGFEKPDPRAFGAVVELLGIDAGEILFVGDDPQRDIMGARNAGMQTCRLRRPDRDVSETEADRVIDSLGELPGLLLGCIRV